MKFYAIVALVFISFSTFADPTVNPLVANATNPVATQTINTKTPEVIPDAPNLAAKSYILIDYDSGDVIASYKPDLISNPASLTKMMTSYVIGQEIKMGKISRTDMVTVSKNAWSKNFPDSSKMFIEVGKQVSVAELNQGIIVQSGNDACVAMAEFIGGTEQAFVDLMNAWAKKLHMNNSFFENPHGLDSQNHKSTARDMATLAIALIRDVPNEYKIYSQKEFTYNGIKQHNRNALLWDSTINVDGVKTGHTSAAGYNLVASATLGNMRLISVVLGTSSEEMRKSESKRLLTYGFKFFETSKPFKAGHVFAKQKIWFGNKKEISLGVNKDLKLAIRRGKEDEITSSYVITKKLNAPIMANTEIGYITFNYNNKEIKRFPLVALENVEQGSWFSRIWDYIVLFFSNLLS